jgi:hypothetical protein
LADRSVGLLVVVTMVFVRSTSEELLSLGKVGVQISS